MYDIYKNTLQSRYDKEYRAARQAYEDGRFEEAADALETAAGLLDDIADAESDSSLTAERRELADSHRETAAELLDLATDKSGVFQPASDDEEPSVDDHQRSDGRDDMGPSTRRATGPHTDEQEDPEPALSEWLSPAPEIDFSDVGGMEQLKEDLIEKIIDPLQYSDLHDRYNLGIASGVLLHGDSGVGKSHIIKALVGELGGDWSHIEVRPSEIMGSLVGEPAQNLREMLAAARYYAPSVVFIDEIDGLFPPRNTGRSSDNQRQLINEMLIQMSDLQREKVVVVGATNVIDQIDDAVMGRHRFSEVIEVTRPGPKAREEILRVHLRDRPVADKTLDYETLRTETTGLTAADLEAIADEAARLALQEAKQTDQSVPVTQDRLLEALDSLGDERDRCIKCGTQSEISS